MLRECSSYLWNGTTYTTSERILYQTTNATGCDSIATLNLTINQPTTFLLLLLQSAYLIYGTVPRTQLAERIPIKQPMLMAATLLQR